MRENETSLFKIKMVFPLPEIQGATPGEALRFARRVVGEPTYVEEFEGAIEYFDFKIPGPEGFRSEAHTWAVEKTSPEGGWGLVYRFTHDLAGVNFAVPFREIALKTLEGFYYLRRAGFRLSSPVLLAYPLSEMEDEPTLSELKVWNDVRPSSFRRSISRIWGSIRES